MSVEIPRLSEVYNPDRLANTGRTYFTDTPTETAFDRLTRLARQFLGVSTVFLSLMESGNSTLASVNGSSDLVNTPSISEFCQQLMETGRPFAVNLNPENGEPSSLTDPSLRSVLGVPLLTTEGKRLGTFCALSEFPRDWAPGDVSLLEDFADLATTEVEVRQARQIIEIETRANDEANRLFQKINDIAPAMIYVFSLTDRRTIYSNRGVTDLLGYPQDLFVAEGDELLLRLIHPDDRATMASLSDTLATLREGEVFQLEYRIRHMLGEWRWLRGRYTILSYQQDSTVEYVLGLAEDISDRKHAEDALHGMTDKLKRSNQTLQDFASVASHDLQEPLRKILQFGSRLQTRQQDDLAPEARDYIERMLRAADRMQGLLGDLLTYSRVTSRAQPFRPVDLNELIGGLISEIGMQRRRAGRIRILSELPTIEGDVAQLRQLFSHLLDNSLKFRQEDVPLEVDIRGEIATVWGVDSCRLSIEDNGIGFEPRFAERIFEVFERLNDRDRYPGTGIGLAICRRIIERHGGSIQAEGIPHEGAIFTVTLPIRQSETTNMITSNATNGRIITPTRETLERLPTFISTSNWAMESGITVTPVQESENK